MVVAQSMWNQIPWTAITTIAVMIWAIGSLAFIERLRKTFATPGELKLAEDRICVMVEEVKKDVHQMREDRKEWESGVEGRTATKADLNGVGSRVNNLEEMYRATQRTAQEAKDASLESRSKIEALTEKVALATSKTDDVGRKVDDVGLQLATMRGELRGYFSSASPLSTGPNQG